MVVIFLMRDYLLNFKILFFALFFLISSCGVKAPPLKPSETVIDSYIGTFTNSSESNKSEEEKIKKAQSTTLEKK